MYVLGQILKQSLLGEQQLAYYGYTLLVFALAALGGYLYGKRLARQGLTVDTVFQKGARAWVILGLFLLSCAMIQVVVTRPTLFSPEFSTNLETLAWGLVKLMVAFIGAMAIPLVKQRSLARLGGTGACAVICLFGIQKTENYMFAPIYPQLAQARQNKDGTILQSTGVTCTPASLANILPLYGIQSSEKECARLLKTRRSGTTDMELMAGLREFGLYGYRIKARPEYLLRINRPAVLTVWISLFHSIALYGKDEKGNFLVIDPIVGKAKYTVAKLTKMQEKTDKHSVIICHRPVLKVTPHSPTQMIAEIQAILRQEKYLQQVSGVYDLATEEAVKAFQKRFELKATGEMDILTTLLLTGPYIGKHQLVTG